MSKQPTYLQQLREAFNPCMSCGSEVYGKLRWSEAKEALIFGCEICGYEREFLPYFATLGEED